MPTRLTSPDPGADCLRQLQHFLALAESGRLTLHLPRSAGLWLRLQGAHFHTSPELFLQPSGVTQFQLPSGKLFLRRQQACLLPAGLPHMDQPAASRQPFRHIVIIAQSPGEIRVHLTLRHPSNAHGHTIAFSRFIQGAAAASMGNYCADILATGHGRYRKTRISALMTALLALLLENWEPATATPSRESSRITLCKQQLSTQLGNPELSVASLARQLECSPDYLSSLYRRECGGSLIAHITQARIDQALFLLRNTAMSIKEITAACGFSRPSYFIHVFHRMQGTTPLQYRAALRAATGG